MRHPHETRSRRAATRSSPDDPESPNRLPHPARYRRPILAAALVAMGTWWGLGLPYSLFTWLLDPKQLRWVLICYAWEVPVCGFVGPVLFPQLWWRDVERRWNTAVDSDGTAIDPRRVAALERTILDYPMRVALVLLVTSLAGYGVGALQLRLFAQLPVAEVVKVCVLGVVTGLVGALFAFLYLEWVLEPLLRRLGSVDTDDAAATSRGRRIPLYAKVFACSLILTLAALLLLGTIFYSRGERILEEEIGRRALVEARALATELSRQGEEPVADPGWWHARLQRMELGRSGYASLVAADGTIVSGTAGAHQLDADGLRSSVVRRILSQRSGHLVDRTYEPRVLGFAPLDDSPLLVVTTVHRSEFQRELDAMLHRGGLVFLMTLGLVFTQGFLFSHRLTRPIEVVTRMASKIAEAPDGAWERVPVRTNDEVGELAHAFNRMTARLEQARSDLARYSAELEVRVAEATRNIATLYDVTRTATSTLELDDVLELVAGKIRAALDLQQLVLLWYPENIGGAVDAYVTLPGHAGEHVELTEAIDLAVLRSDPRRPGMTAVAALAPGLPASVVRTLVAPEVFYLPLLFKDQLLGVMLASLEPRAGAPDLELAATLAGQTAVALANAGLFQTARRHEAELRKLSQIGTQLQEESVRSMARELHDGIGQVLTAIKIDLGMIERAAGLDVAALRARVGEAREQVTGLLQEVRRMSQLLRPAMLDDFGLVPTLQWLTETFTARTQIAVELRTPPADTRLPGTIEVLLYRVTQEALTNVVKHAQARHVGVDLTVQGSEAALTIVDDGVGFDVERFRRKPALGGVGLLGMRERVAYYNGRIEITSRPHAGVRISLTIPLAGTGEQSEGGRATLAR